MQAKNAHKLKKVCARTNANGQHVYVQCVVPPSKNQLCSCVLTLVCSCTIAHNML